MIAVDVDIPKYFLRADLYRNNSLENVDKRVNAQDDQTAFKERDRLIEKHQKIGNIVNPKLTKNGQIIG
ncbi:MAG: hypothetical protein LiPW41_771 [Parcubacteria group bacterium LiPW_41]|nr:MAG: hypothetical protein LiPW41_771 [Parcubacteria group bacterium LiPW_41]